MLIYPDTNHLINMARYKKPVSLGELKTIFIQGGHYLVLSMWNILEFSADYMEGKGRGDTLSLLNEIEEIPHKIIGPTEKLELEEAFSAFQEGREYVQINPFVRRFDYVMEYVPSVRLVGVKIIEVIDWPGPLGWQWLGALLLQGRKNAG